MRVQKASAGLSVLDSGTFILVDNTADAHFTIEMDEDFSFDITLEFRGDDSTKHNVNSKVEDNSIIFTCINFDNPLGTGTIKPLEVASYNDKKIYFHYWVYLQNKTVRTIDYTFYIER